MRNVLIVVDREEDWEPYYPSEHVLSFEQYLEYQPVNDRRLRVINLCSDYRYLSQGYYCSLLAEARGHHVIPPSRVLNDVATPLLYQLDLKMLEQMLKRIYRHQEAPDELVFKSYFGQVTESSLRALARLLFERFPCPILGLTLRCSAGQWVIAELSLVDHKSLTDEEETAFGEALENFSREIWRRPRTRKAARYDLAMLVNQEESLPPSNAGALRKFIQAGRNLGVNVEQIGPDDFMRLSEFDALFIRETTGIQHHTYRFPRRRSHPVWW